MDVDRALALATRLMDEHGLIEQGWEVDLNSSWRRRLGSCSYNIHRITISESHVVLNDEEVVVDTILHEIAHALAGADARHGPRWKEIAQRIGATPRARTSLGVAAEARWHAVCQKCEQLYERDRRPSRQTSCSSCSKKFDPDAILEWCENPEWRNPMA